MFLDKARHFHLRDFVLVGPLTKQPFLPVIPLVRSLTSFKTLLKAHLLSEADLYLLFISQLLPQLNALDSPLCCCAFYFFCSVQNLSLFSTFIFFPLGTPAPHGQGVLCLSCSLLHVELTTMTDTQ